MKIKNKGKKLIDILTICFCLFSTIYVGINAYMISKNLLITVLSVVIPTLAGILIGVLFLNED